MLIYFKNYPSSDSYRVGNDETVYKSHLNFVTINKFQIKKSSL